MPVEYQVGDIFKSPEINVILHQANIYNTLAKRCSSGFAAVVEKVCPKACDADGETVEGDEGKIGSYSTGYCDNGTAIFNCYTQTGMGAKDRNTSYNDILCVFKDIESRCLVYNQKIDNGLTGDILGKKKTKKIVGIPYKYGSGLAGGSFLIVNAIIREVFEDSPVRCIVMRLPSGPEVKL